MNLILIISLLFHCTPKTLLTPIVNYEKIQQNITEILPEGDPQCPYGGTRFTQWIDQNKIDGVYTESEDSNFSETITCFPISKSSGSNSVITTVSLEIGDPQCPNGGTQIESFTDLNNNGTYESTDIYHNIKYSCNGSSSITLNNSLPSGDSTCPAGGTQLLTFTDINHNGSYEVSVDKNMSSYKVCNGQKSLVTTISINSGDTTCTAGGTQFISCIDSNADNTCTTSDLNYSTQKICKGTASNFILTPESPGLNCKSGGYKLERFQDINNNNIYDISIDTGYTTQYICHGLNWLSKATKFTAGNGTAGDNTACPRGGSRFEFGYDHVNSADNSYFIGTDGVLDNNEIVNSATSYSCNGSHGGTAGPLIANFQNDSEGTKARFYWEVLSADGGSLNIKIGYSNTKAGIEAWNCENTLPGITVITNFSSCTDTTYRTSTTGNLTANAICGFDLTTAPFNLNPWDYRYFKLCAQNNTIPYTQNLSTFRIAGNVPSGMVMVHSDDWPTHEFANTNIIPFTYAIDKWETYLSSGAITNGIPGVCDSNSCISTSTATLSSASGQIPVRNIDWYASRKGCANRTAIGYTGATTPRSLHMQTEMENFVANYGTPDEHFSRYGREYNNQTTTVMSPGYLGCNTDLKHYPYDNSYNNNQYFQTGDDGTENCISRYGARDMIGNFSEFVDGYYEFLTNNTTRQKSIYWGTSDKITTVISDAVLGYVFPIATSTYFTQDWDYQNLLPKNSIVGSASMPSPKYFLDVVTLDFTSATRILIKDKSSWYNGSNSGRFAKSLEYSATRTSPDLSNRCAVLSP